MARRNKVLLETRSVAMIAYALVAGQLALGACSGDDSDADDSSTGTDGSPEQTGAVCEVADDCYPKVADGELAGDAICLDRVRGGYCTHECSADEDCCAAEGECDTDLEQVCSPFESANNMMCFLSCESEVVQAGDYADDQDFCQREASSDFICRSSGGGSANRKVCVPGDCGVGAKCASDADCTGDLTCLKNFDGGYCGTKDCSDTGDCPENTECVTLGGAKYCVKNCATDSDCSFCRGSEHPLDCVSHDDSANPVCLPE